MNSRRALQVNWVLPWGAYGVLRVPRLCWSSSLAPSEVLCDLCVLVLLVELQRCRWTLGSCLCFIIHWFRASGLVCAWFVSSCHPSELASRDGPSSQTKRIQDCSCRGALGSMCHLSELDLRASGLGARWRLVDSSHLFQKLLLPNMVMTYNRFRMIRKLWQFEYHISLGSKTESL